MSKKLKVVSEAEPTISDDTLVDLVDLVREEVDNLQTNHPEITIRMEMPNKAWIEGEESIQYAIREVLENSVSHFDGSLDECELAIAIERTKDTVSLEISDNGPGIPSDELAPLQSQKETPLVHASSVGLWIIRWLAKLHDGIAKFRSDSEEGTTVRFEFNSTAQMPILNSHQDTVENLKNVSVS